MKPIQVNKDGALGCKELERERNTMVRENVVGKWCGLILTVGLNKQHLRMFAKGVNQIEQ